MRQCATQQVPTTHTLNISCFVSPSSFVCYGCAPSPPPSSRRVVSHHILKLVSLSNGLLQQLNALCVAAASKGGVGNLQQVGGTQQRRAASGELSGESEGGAT